MAYLIGSASTTRFSATYAINSGPDDGFMRLFMIGRDDESNNSIATGTAQNLHLYISSWGTLSNIKFNIYDETGGGGLVESVIIPSSAGTGQISVALAGTTTITTGRLYRGAIYTEDNNAITMYSDTGGLTLRYTDSGTYTTPLDPLAGNYTYDSFNELYWAVDDVASGASIDSIDDPITDGETGNAFEFTGFVSGVPTSGTIDGVAMPSVSAAGSTGTFDNFDITAVSTGITGTVVPDFGVVSAEFTNGTETAALDTTNNPAAGWSNVTVAGIDTVTASFLYQLITTQIPTIPAPANGDTWYFPTADSTAISAAGGITTNATSFTFYYEHDIAGTLKAYELTWRNGDISPVIRTKFRRFPWQPYYPL